MTPTKAVDRLVLAALLMLGSSNVPLDSIATEAGFDGAKLCAGLHSHARSDTLGQAPSAARRERLREPDACSSSDRSRMELIGIKARAGRGIPLRLAFSACPTWFPVARTGFSPAL
jgi:hypothetical protein